MAAEDELNNELREELNDSVGCVDDQDFLDDQSDSWLSTSAASEPGRIPGRGVELHEKLLSPSRRSKNEKLSIEEGRTLAEQLADKQLKVMELRERRQREKIERCAMLSKKVEEVRIWKNELMEDKRRALENKLKAAEQRRKDQLLEIVRKAHDEEAKGSEIAFINNIEAESRKQEMQAKYQLWKQRLQEITDEQKKRLEASAAKKSAASFRKKAIDAERLTRMQEILKRQQERERKAEERQAGIIQERVAVCKQREREHEERMAQRKIADEERKQELKQRIKGKQDEYARRHNEQIEQRREKAVALSSSININSPRHPTPTCSPSGFTNNANHPLEVDMRKYCTVCFSVIDSEYSLLEHAKNRQHRTMCNVPKDGPRVFSKASMQAIVPFSLLLSSSNAGSTLKKLESESSGLNAKVIRKKRSKKFKQKILNEKCLTYNESGDLGKISVLVRELDVLLDQLTTTEQLIDRVFLVERLAKQLVHQVSGRSCRESKQGFCNKFYCLNGYKVFEKILVKYIPIFIGCPKESMEQKGKQRRNGSLEKEVGTLIVNVFLCLIQMTENNPEVSIHVLSNAPMLPIAIFDFIVLVVGSIAQEGIETCTLKGAATEKYLTCHYAAIQWCINFFDGITSCMLLYKLNDVEKEVGAKAMDCLNYLISNGFIERTTQIIAVATYLTDFRDKSICDMLKSLSTLIGSCCRIPMLDFGVSDKNNDDNLLFMAALRYSDFCGILFLIYALMLKETDLVKQSTAFADLPNHCLSLLYVTYFSLTAAAVLEPVLLQTSLTTESPLLLGQFRQVSSYLLSLVNEPNLTQQHYDVIHQVVLSVGIFALENHEQAENIMGVGQPPTILQQLCQMPIWYFTDPKQSHHLIPSLIAITFGCDKCVNVLKTEVNPDLLLKYIQSYMDMAKKGVKLSNTHSLASRFSEAYLTEAMEWFSKYSNFSTSA